ncbi:MAG: M23 family metallopeptidase [Steroidobacteraceae bacterium]
MRILACVLVAWCAWLATRQRTESIPAPGSVLFTPQGDAAGLATLAGAPQLAPGLASLEVIVKRNDTLDRIFRNAKLNLTDLANMRAVDGARAMLDKLRPGELLRFTHRDGSVISLERHLSLTEKLQMQRGSDGFRADILAKPVEVERVVAHGVIHSSLFQAAGDVDMQDQTVLDLARIFGWDIDFVLDLRAGDDFTVLYERLHQDGKYVQDGNILAARFVNQGRVVEAVRYTSPDGEARYYTPDGRSMEKAFLRAPLEFRRISSGFSLGRFHPILNKIRAHKGTDYAAPIGTPVEAAGNGRVRFKGWKGGYGNELEIDHGGGIVTVYGHLSRFAAGINEGTRVTQGQTIAYVGMTGLATGPHLHYEYRLNGVFLDPQKVKLPQATPIDASLRGDFVNQSAPLLAALSKIQDPVTATAVPVAASPAAAPAAR